MLIGFTDPTGDEPAEKPRNLSFPILFIIDSAIIDRHEFPVHKNKQFKILNAEWAHLNRPDRLRKLAEYYFSELRLTPINPDDFISFSDVYWGQFIEDESTALAVKQLTETEHKD